MKKILIIGANSFIARNLIYSIKDNKDTSLSLVDYQKEQIDNVPNYLSLNLLEKDDWKKVDLGVDIIYFFTGMTGAEKSIKEYSLFIDVNEKILLNCLNEYINQNSRAKLVFPSTRLVYKGSNDPLLETDEKEAKTIYAANKISCENYLKLYNNLYGVNYCTLRICVPFGTLINNASSYGTAEFFINKGASGNDLTLYGDGNLYRTFTYIGDLCEVLLKVGMSENCLNDEYNIGGVTTSLKELAELVSRKYNVGIINIPWPETALKLESGSTVFNSTKLDKLIKKESYLSIHDWIMKV